MRFLSTSSGRWKALATILVLAAQGAWAQNCPVPTKNGIRVSVSGFGYVTDGESPTGATGISCGSSPASGPTSTRCFKNTDGGFVTLTAVPYSSNFRFASWTGAPGCTTNATCVVDASTSRWVKAKFLPVVAGSNICTHLGLVSDKANHPLNGNFPALALGQAFTDPNFGTTIRRVTAVGQDGRGNNRVLKTAYSTISAWNADETYLILYRADGSTSSVHELFNGKTYQFIRQLSDLPTADLEQFYWDTTRPNIVYGMSGRILYEYNVDAPAGQRLTVVRDFTPQCGTKSLYGGSDPFFNSWDSKLFGFVCISGGGPVFGYNRGTNTVGSLYNGPRSADSMAPQAAPSATKLFLNLPQPGPIQVFNFNMVPGPTLDMASGDEHASVGLLSDGTDSYVAIAFSPGPSGTPEGEVVQWILQGTPNAQNRIPGRVIVGEATGYPYPPSGEHIGATAFNRTGLITHSTIGNNYTGATLLGQELLYIDVDPATNTASNVCRVGHHRSTTNYYFGEPHPSISPSGTRIAFSTAWGDLSATPIVNTYVVELPGYRP